jgi:hypothetical protein
MDQRLPTALRQRRTNDQHWRGLELVTDYIQQVRRLSYERDVLWENPDANQREQRLREIEARQRALLRQARDTAREYRLTRDQVATINRRDLDNRAIMYAPPPVADERRPVAEQPDLVHFLNQIPPTYNPYNARVIGRIHL